MRKQDTGYQREIQALGREQSEYIMDPLKYYWKHNGTFILVSRGGQISFPISLILT